MLEPIERARLSLRRYRSGSEGGTEAQRTCPGPMGYHDATAPIDEVDDVRDDVGNWKLPSGDLWPHDDPRWPTACGCGYQFVTGDAWQLFVDHLWRRLDTGEIVALRDASVGAMWYADWLPWRGPDGRCLCVKTPGGDWVVDGPATNSDRVPAWTRTGVPPDVTVDGSIGAGTYHGWLRGGFLVEV